MTHVSIIGNGNMGQAISSIVTKGGNTVEVLDQSDADKPATGDIVVLAVPYPAVADVIAQRADQFAGKVVVDITNPLNFETFDSLTVPGRRLGRRRDRRRTSPVARPQGVQHHLRGHPGLRHRRTRPDHRPHRWRRRGCQDPAGRRHCRRRIARPRRRRPVPGP